MRNTLQKYTMLFLLFAAACKKPANNHPGPNPDPDKPATIELTSFLPVKGMAQTEVKIKGKNFHTTKAMNEVRFGGTLTQVLEASATELTVTVPANAVTGKITVKVGDKTATSATGFTVEADVLSIIDFTPKEGPFGTVVTITGRLFGDDITVKLNGVTAKLKERNATFIKFEIPANTTLTAHKIQVTSGTEVVETATNFTVTSPAGAYGEWVSLNKGLVLPNVFPAGVSFVHKNKIYWGFAKANFLGETMYGIYDPAEHDKGWQLHNPPAEMVPADLIYATAIVQQNRVFFGTGFTKANTSDWWEYKPETNTATRLTDYPEKAASALSFVLNGQIYVGFGGISKQLYTFNPAGTGTWQPAVTGTFRELTHGTVFVLGNDAYMGSVLGQLSGFRNALFKFTAPDQLTQVASTPEGAVAASASFVIGNKGYLVSQRTVFEYTPDATGGSIRVVVHADNSPVIARVAEIMVNGVKEVYGWEGSGELYKFRFK